MRFDATPSLPIAVCRSGARSPARRAPPCAVSASRAGRGTAVSIITISSALGSAGEAIGRALAEELTYTFADREIILKAAERLGQGVAELERLLEGRPSLRERLLETRRDYLAAVEAVVWEFAARDNVVLIGRGSTFVLQRIRHAIRVRVTAPLHVRARRLEAERGLVPDAEDVVARRATATGRPGSAISTTWPWTIPSSTISCSTRRASTSPRRWRRFARCWPPSASTPRRPRWPRCATAA